MRWLDDRVCTQTRPRSPALACSTHVTILDCDGRDCFGAVAADKAEGQWSIHRTNQPLPHEGNSMPHHCYRRILFYLPFLTSGRGREPSAQRHQHDVIIAIPRTSHHQDEVTGHPSNDRHVVSACGKSAPTDEERRTGISAHHGRPSR